MHIIIEQVTPIIDYSVRELCSKPYPGHEQGCPNFGRKKGCPPNADEFAAVFDLTRPIYAIINAFDYKAFVDEMRKLHPDWSDGELDYCFSWEPKARKELQFGINGFLNDHPDYVIVSRPEAMGINITATLAGIGIKLEWPPKTVTYQVALAGIKKIHPE